MLQHIFGPIIDVLVRGADPNTVSASSNILAAMFGYFNSGLLAVASIIISYVATVGAINTANDGEAMGKAWSSVWTPLRIVTFGGVLLPSASGYSFLQMFVLTLALWSVGFANGIYKLGMSMGLLKPDGIVASSYQPGTYLGMRDFAKQYLSAAYCARSANSVYADPAGSPMVMADSGNPDRKTTTGTRTDYTYYIRDRNPATNLSGGEPVCGTVTLSVYSVSGSYSDTSGTQAALDALRASLAVQKINATTALMRDIDNWVATMPADINQTGWDQIKSSRLNEIVKAREDQVAAQIGAAMSGSGDSPAASAVKQGSSAFIDSLTREGWAMAAGWYQRVGLLRTKLSTITSESVGEVTRPSLSGLPSDARAKLLMSSVGTVTETIIKKSEQAGNGYEGGGTPKPEDLASLLPTSGGGDINVGSLSNDMSRKLTDFVNSMMQGATNTAIGSGPGVDAIARMKLTGDLLASYRAMFMAAKFSINTAMTAARVVVSGVGGVQVLGTKIDESGPMTAVWDWLQAEVISTLAEIAQYLGVLAFYFSVVLPSLPYTIFMITVVGWLLGVLQTVIAAPLWAVMHMRPSQTFIGSDAQGYLLLLALFVRPALAVLGLFAAMLVADPIVDYITRAFFAMRGDVVASTGWVGAISQFFTFFWWFVVFGAVLLPVLYMIYGLPQVLPDHVLRWINAGVHDLGATGASSAMQSRMSPLAAGAGRDEARRMQSYFGGGEGGGGDGGGSGDGGGRGPRQRDGGGSRQQRNEPISAGDQGITPAANDSEMSPGERDAATGTDGGRSSRGGSGAMSSGPQGASGSSRSSRRGFVTRASDAAGVALGRAATDTTMAVRDAASGGREGFGGRLASNLKDAAVSVGSESAAAFREGADSRVAAFKSQMALRSALSGDPGDADASGGQSPGAAPGGARIAEANTASNEAFVGSSGAGPGGSGSADGSPAEVAIAASSTTADGAHGDAAVDYASGVTPDAAQQPEIDVMSGGSAAPAGAAEGSAEAEELQRILASSQAAVSSSSSHEPPPPTEDV